MVSCGHSTSTYCAEPGWNDHGFSLARWDNLHTDGLGRPGPLVPGLRTCYARLRPPLSSSLDVAGADAGRQPPGALSRRRMRESGGHVQPRGRIVHQSAALGAGLGGVLWARPAPRCPPLVGPPASCSMKGHAPAPVVRRCHRALEWPVPNHASGKTASPCTAR
jgi:hypothetical protein